MRIPARKHLILFLLIALCGLPSCRNKTENIMPRAQKGILDCQGVDTGKTGPIALAGEWEFYWKKFIAPELFLVEHPADKPLYITVPGAWNDTPAVHEKTGGNGFATYRLRLASVPPGDVAFKIIFMATAYRLFINGTLVAENGRVGETRDSSHPGLKPQIVYFHNEVRDMDLILHISNFHHRVGGSWHAILMGTPRDITSLREKNIGLNLFLLGAILIMFLYHLSLYIILKRQSRSLLYFSLICLFIAVRIMVSGEYYLTHICPDLSWLVINRLEYLSFVITVPLLAMFTFSLYPEEIKKVIVRVIQAVSLVMSVIILVTPSWIYTFTAHGYQAFAVLAGLYIHYALILSLSRRREGAFILLAGFLLLYLTAVNDILHDDGIIQTGYFIPAGLIMFIFSQAFLLSFKFSHSFRDVEILSASLRKKSADLELKNITLEKTHLKMEELNRGLEEKVRERTRELAMANEKLENMAHYDQLTGVPNRWLFYDRLKMIIEQSLREKSEFAVFYMDLDGFKEVNDEYGHETGDRILRELSDRLAALLRKSDTLGRLGGDEFAFLIPGIKDSNDAVQTAEKILSAMHNSFLINDRHIQFTASIGISLFPTDSMDSEDLVKKADKAMYLAKKSGKNRYLFYKSIN